MGEERRFEPLDGGTSGAGGMGSGKLGRVSGRNIHRGRTGNAEMGLGKMGGFCGSEAKGFNVEDAEGAEYLWRTTRSGCVRDVSRLVEA